MPQPRPTLTLVAVSLNEQPLSQPITAVFDERGGTIGRGDHNTMALPDPQRHISRLQAEVVAQGDVFLIRNVGAANPISVAGQALAHGDSATLSGAEPLRIGGYLLKAQLGVAAPATALEPALPGARTPTPRPTAAPQRHAAAPSDVFADLLGAGAGTAGSNPFADLLGEPSATPSATPSPIPAAIPAATTPPSRRAASPPDPFAGLLPPPAGVAAGSAALVSPGPAATSRLPDDFDPFAAPAPARAHTGAPPHAPPHSPPITQADPLADFGFASDAGQPSMDQFFGLGSHAPSSASADPLANFLDHTPARQVEPAQHDHLPALNAAWSAPRVAPPVPPVPPAAAPSPPSPPTAPSASLAGPDAIALWNALLEGAGLPPAAQWPTPGAPEAQMRELGRIVRSAMDGILQLIAVRASTKHELRAGVTVIQAQHNNPLKFSPDARAALEQLLAPPLRGFLDGPAAMDDAMHDLVGHAIGSVAGLRAAVEGMLDRFAPQALEAKLGAGSLLGNLLPMQRKARLWDLYLQHHAAIRDEAEEDFHTLFGKAFLAAYEQQIERLRREAAGR